MGEGIGGQAETHSDIHCLCYTEHEASARATDIMSVCRTCSTKSNDAPVNTRVLVEKDISQLRFLSEATSENHLHSLTSRVHDVV